MNNMEGKDMKKLFTALICAIMVLGIGGCSSENETLTDYEFIEKMESMGYISGCKSSSYFRYCGFEKDKIGIAYNDDGLLYIDDGTLNKVNEAGFSVEKQNVDSLIKDTKIDYDEFISHLKNIWNTQEEARKQIIKENENKQVNQNINDNENSTNEENKEHQNYESDKTVVTLGAGNYVVGEDIDSGKYDITAESGKGTIYITNVIGELMGIDKENYLTKFSNAKLENGVEIEITGTLILRFDKK